MNGLYLVVDESKFCTTQFDSVEAMLESDKMVWLGVLVDKTFSGSHRPDHAPLIFKKDQSTVRKATIKDFEDYRISVPSNYK